MKRALVLSALFFLLVSAAAAQWELLGYWEFREVIGGVAFYDYITITTVNLSTRKVSGYITGLSSYKVTGYYYGNIVYIEDNFADYYLDGYYFTYYGSPRFKKHLGIYSGSHSFDASWHNLTVTKLATSTIPGETPTISSVLNQKALKKQAQLREIAERTPD